MSKNIIYVDIDNTICSPISKNYAVDEIKDCKPRKQIIKKINKLKLEGKIIVYWTHRDKICEKETIKWFKKYNVLYDYIIFGKPKYHLYIGDRAINSKDFLNGCN